MINYITISSLGYDKLCFVERNNSSWKRIYPFLFISLHLITAYYLVHSITPKRREKKRERERASWQQLKSGFRRWTKAILWKGVRIGGSRLDNRLPRLARQLVTDGKKNEKRTTLFRLFDSRNYSVSSPFAKSSILWNIFSNDRWNILIVSFYVSPRVGDESRPKREQRSFVEF